MSARMIGTKLAPSGGGLRRSVTSSTVRAFTAAFWGPAGIAAFMRATTGSIRRHGPERLSQMLCTRAGKPCSVRVGRLGKAASHSGEQTASARRLSEPHLLRSARRGKRNSGYVEITRQPYRFHCGQAGNVKLNHRYEPALVTEA